MIPEAEGESTPLGQRPSCVLPVVYRLWASVRLAHIQFLGPRFGIQCRKGGIFG